jgi:hypothetical protein
MNDIGEIAGIVFLQDTVSQQVIAHELGHVFGLGHTNLFNCPRNTFDGEWDAGCLGVEYGGGIDLMSNVDSLSPLSIYHQWKIGFVSDDQIVQLQSDAVINILDINSETGTKGIFFRTDTRAYWLEYRNRISAAPFKSGLVLYRADPPPSGSSIVSPNPNDQRDFSGDPTLSTDIWMMNLEDYRYLNGQVSGSMSLVMGKALAIEEGKYIITLQSSDEESAKVKIDVAKRRVPLPKPRLITQAEWGADSEILSNSYSLKNTSILGFDVYIDGKFWRTVSEKVSTDAQRLYLDPLRTRAIMTQKALPEGKYAINVRARDIWGNVSELSNIVQVQIDRGSPQFAGGVDIVDFDEREISANLVGINDAGSQLCRSSLMSPVGFALQTSTNLANPNFRFPINRTISNILQTFDCAGNGRESKIVFTSELIKMKQVRKTGKWTILQSGSIDEKYKCNGNCTISITFKDSLTLGGVSGDLQVLAKEQEVISTYNAKSSIQNIRWNHSGQSRILRISGKNFQIKSLIKSEIKFDDLKNISGENYSSPKTSEDSFEKLGFEQMDWPGAWIVSPITRGTTLEDPTLDFCAEKYSSEGSRVQRRQVAVSKSKSPYVFLSSEVVKYESALASEAAFEELLEKVSQCREKNGFITSYGEYVEHDFLSNFTKVERIDKKNKRVIILAKIGSTQNARILLAYYQFSGEYFSGLYVVLPSSTNFSSVELSSWNEIADVLLDRISGN